jgi:hypothetical protein
MPAHPISNKEFCIGSNIPFQSALKKRNAMLPATLPAAREYHPRCRGWLIKNGLRLFINEGRTDTDFAF